jgi:hypothetical protein
MNGETAYSVWAPEQSVWSPWVKPLLFTRLQEVQPGAAPTAGTPAEPAWLERNPSTAIVADLPGVQGVHFGLLAAGRGYRPVPLYNAAPPDDRNPAAKAAVDMKGVIEAVAALTGELARSVLAAEAPPAFLIDSERMGRAKPEPGHYDNRWVVFPQDFPSARFLLSHGISRALLVTMTPGTYQDDLAHVLLRWQQNGIALFHAAWNDSRIQPLQARKPSWFRWAFYRLLIAAGLRRNSAGGFGEIVPAPQATRPGGGFYGGFG